MRIISKREACHKTSLSRTHLDRLIAEGKFPKPVPLTQGRVGFPEEEVDIWIKRRITERTPIILLREKGKAAAKARAEAKREVEAPVPANDNRTPPKGRLLSLKEVCDITRRSRTDIVTPPANDNTPEDEEQAA